MGFKSCFLWLFLLISGQVAFAQLDQEFWFAAPDISNQHQGDDRPVRFRMSTLDEPATIRLSMPANPSFQTRIVELAANSTATIQLDNPLEYENTPPNQISNKGFRVTSTTSISCFYEVGELWNVDIFALKGRNALGQEFIMPNQTFWGISGTLSDAHSSLTVVAVEDRTVVTIIPTQPVVGYPANDTITVILNRGQTFSTHSLNHFPGSSLNGTVITANKPIAVTLSDDSLFASSGGCFDLAGDQIVPVGVLGEEHVIAKGALNQDERLFITAVKDSTVLFINNVGAPVDTLNRGETYTHLVSAITYVKTSAPVYVMHYTGIGCEIGAALIPSINCKGSNQVGFTRSSEEEFYMTVLVRRGGQHSFSLNGGSQGIPSGSFTPVPGTDGEWMISSLRYELNTMPAGRSFLLRNEEYSFQLGILDGGPGTGTRYGYFSNFASLFIGDDFTLCTGAERIIVPKGEAGASYLWSDGSTGPSLTVSEAGDYWVTMTNSSGCTLTDTLTVDVNPESFLDLDESMGGCEGDVVTVDPGVHASYEWSNGTRNRFLRTSTPGIYSVEVINANGCLDRDTVEVSFQEKHDVDLGMDQFVCPGTEIALNATVDGAERYRWQDGVEEPLRTIVDPGIYWADVTIGVCTVRDSLLLENHPEPEVPTIVGTQVVCPGVQNLTYESMEKNFVNFAWSVDGGTLVASNDASATVSWGQTRSDAQIGLIVTDSVGCTADTSFLDVRINLKLEPPLPLGDTIVCSNHVGVAYEVPETNGSTYRWVLSAGENIGEVDSHQAAVNWPGDGTYQLYVVEESVTPDTVCAGTSPPLEVLVYTDSTRIDLRRVSTAENDDQEIQVHWDINYPQQIEGMLTVFRTTEAGGQFDIEVNPGLQAFRDFDLSTDTEQYSYAVSATNGCGQQLSTSSHRSIVLDGEGEESTGMVSLAWNGYESWDAAPNYELWRLLDGEEDFSFFRDLGSSALSFAEARAADAFDHQYRIKAVGSTTEEFSWSNIIAFAFEHELVIPNVFTPNGDEINDRFEIENIGLYESNLLEVYSRQGSVVYRKSGYNNTWDGEGVPTGQYYYRLTIRNLDLTYKGTLTILR